MLEKLQNQRLHLSDFLKMSFGLFQENLKAIFLLILCVYGPIVILENVVMINMISLNFTDSWSNIVAAMEGNSIYYLVLLLIYVFLEPLARISIIKTIDGNLRNKPVRLSEAVLGAFEKMPKFAVASVLHLVGITIGLCVFVIPGIYLEVIWVFYLYSIALSDRNPIQALRYSKTLVKGNWGNTFGMLLIVTFIVWAINSGISGIFLVGTDNFVIEVIRMLVMELINSFTVIFFTILYLHRDALANPKPQDTLD